MSTTSSFLSTAIPYVNGSPHVGHALEFVIADAIARHRRRLGSDLRFQSGTDDNSLKNARAAAVLDRVGADAFRYCVLRHLHTTAAKRFLAARGS